MKKLNVILLVVLLLFSLTACFYYVIDEPMTETSAPAPEASAAVPEPADADAQEEYSIMTDEDLGLVETEVLKVVDGDTLKLKNADFPDGIRCRLIGIDTPESVVDEEKTGKKNTEEGVQASDRTKEIIAAADNIVYLEYDVDLYDQYDRLLAYAYVLQDGDYVMIEEILLTEGLCKAVRFEPDTKYADYFYSLQDEAKANGVGLWGTGFY